MKRFLAIFLLPLALQAATVTLAWDANDPAEQITAYKLYELQADNVTWTVVGTTPGTQLVLSGVVGGVHTYAVTAVNVWSESLRSTSVITPKNSKPPGNPRLVSITVP